MINYGESQDHSICPSGDVDYFQFNGEAGDRIVVDIDSTAVAPPSDLDYYLFLLDSDGKSVLAEHDDEIFAERRDPHLGYLIDRSGTYFLKLRSWAHPSAGGSAYTYSIHLAKDNLAPTANFTYPLSGSILPDGEINLQLEAIDATSGISHVDFLWHSGDWLHDTWNTLGSDWDGADGWGLAFDSNPLPAQKDVAFYAHVYDWAGNWRGVGVWELGIKLTSVHLPLVHR